MAFSPDGRYCITAAKFGYDLIVWWVAGGTVGWENRAPSEVECVAYAPDGAWIAAGNEDFKVDI